MKRRLIIFIVSMTMALHGAVPMGLAGAVPAAGQDGSLLAALQVICTGDGVVDRSSSHDPAEDLQHDCKACPAPGQGFAMACGAQLMPAPVPDGHTKPWRAGEYAAPGVVLSSQWTRAPPVFL